MSLPSEPPSVSSRHYSIRSVVIGFLVLGIVFTAISTVLVVKQFRSDIERISGTVLVVEEGTITIRDAHGATTTIIVTTDTRLRDLERPLSQHLTPGTYLYSAGTYNDNHTFTAYGIRRIDTQDN